MPSAEIIIRRVFGVGGAGMTNRHRFTRRYAWPSADWGSLPIEGGIEAAYRRDLEASDGPAALFEEIRKRLDAIRSPFRTAEHFGIEEIIDPKTMTALRSSIADLRSPALEHEHINHALSRSAREFAQRRSHGWPPHAALR